MITAFKKQGQLTKRQYTIAIMNTTKIAKSCNFLIPKQDIDLPKTRYEKDASGISAIEILKQFCQIGIKHFYPKGMSSEYTNRYQEEIDMIEKKGFTRYFLIIYELVEWCKKEGIMVGPGRGSVGGSTIARYLGITWGSTQLNTGCYLKGL